VGWKLTIATIFWKAVGWSVVGGLSVAFRGSTKKLFSWHTSAIFRLGFQQDSDFVESVGDVGFGLPTGFYN
jgi:hypothetical protein